MPRRLLAGLGAAPSLPEVVLERVHRVRHTVARHPHPLPHPARREGSTAQAAAPVALRNAKRRLGATCPARSRIAVLTSERSFGSQPLRNNTWGKSFHIAANPLDLWRAAAQQICWQGWGSGRVEGGVTCWRPGCMPTCCIPPACQRAHQPPDAAPGTGGGQRQPGQAEGRWETRGGTWREPADGRRGGAWLR